MSKLYFKTNRQQTEWGSENINIKLIQIISWLCFYVKIVYPEYKGLTLTDVFRTQKEQDKIYLNHIDPAVASKYKKNPWNSVHEFWRGVDVRSNDMPGQMAFQMVTLLEQIPYDENRRSIKTVKYHSATGKNPDHLHIQVMG